MTVDLFGRHVLKLAFRSPFAGLMKAFAFAMPNRGRARYAIDTHEDVLRRHVAR